MPRCRAPAASSARPAPGATRSLRASRHSPRGCRGITETAPTSGGVGGRVPSLRNRFLSLTSRRGRQRSSRRRLQPVACSRHPVAIRLEWHLEEIAVLLLVLNDQYV